MAPTAVVIETDSPFHVKQTAFWIVCPFLALTTLGAGIHTVKVFVWGSACTSVWA